MNSHAVGTVGGVEIRRATLADIDEILAVLGAVADEGRWLATGSAPDFISRRERFENSVVRDDMGMFVAVAQAQIVGEISIMPENTGVYAIGMAVAGAWRGRGVGSQLLSAGIEWARARGAHKIYLEVFPHNAAALALYEKFGFKREGVRSKHYRRENGELWDSIMMGLVFE